MFNTNVSHIQNNKGECISLMRSDDLVGNCQMMSNALIYHIESQPNLNEFIEWSKTVEWEKIEFSMTHRFWEKFYKAAKFVSNNPGELFSVYCADNNLITSNGIMSVSIQAKTPTELIGKSVIDILDYNVASVLKKGWCDEERVKNINVLLEPSYYDNAEHGTKEDMPIKYYTAWRSDKGNYPLVQINDIFLDRGYWDSVMCTIEKDKVFDVFFPKDKEGCILVKTNILNAIIYPAHVEDGCRLELEVLPTGIEEALTMNTFTYYAAEQELLQIFYALAMKNESGVEEYLHEVSGDDCFSDDIGNAIFYADPTQCPSLLENNYIVIVEKDAEGCLSVKGKVDKADLRLWKRSFRKNVI